MSGDLELRAQDTLEQALEHAAAEPQLVLPFTGELVDLRKPAEVAHALDQVHDAKRRLDQLRGLLETLLRAESQEQGTKTLHLQGNLTAIVSGGERTVYDGEQLAREFEQAGLPADRLAVAVKVIVEYKPDARVLKQLQASNPSTRPRSRAPAGWRRRRGASA